MTRHRAMREKSVKSYLCKHSCYHICMHEKMALPYRRPECVGQDKCSLFEGRER